MPHLRKEIHQLINKLIDFWHMPCYIIEQRNSGAILMPTPIDRAKSDLKDIDRRIEAMQAERRRIAEFIQMYERYAIDTEYDSYLVDRPKKEVIGDEAEALISQQGKPVPLGEIFDAVESRGIVMGEANPRQYLSSILNRDGRFQFVKGLGWDLKAPQNTEGSDEQTSEPSNHTVDIMNPTVHG